MSENAENKIPEYGCGYVCTRMSAEASETIITNAELMSELNGQMNEYRRVGNNSITRQKHVTD